MSGVPVQMRASSQEVMQACFGLCQSQCYIRFDSTLCLLALQWCHVVFPLWFTVKVKVLFLDRCDEQSTSTYRAPPWIWRHTAVISGQRGSGRRGGGLGRSAPLWGCPTGTPHSKHHESTRCNPECCSSLQRAGSSMWCRPALSLRQSSAACMQSSGRGGRSWSAGKHPLWALHWSPRTQLKGCCVARPGSGYCCLCRM